MTATTLRLDPTPISTNPFDDRADPAERGWLLGLALLHAALAGIAFLVLGSVFDFPGILREPAAVVLATFDESQTTIRSAYYAFAMSSLLLIPMAVLLSRAVAPRRDGLSRVAVVLGAAAGLTQLLGFIRWTIFVPFLADTYADPTTSPATREAVAVAYEIANRYLGMTVGEHLGWVFQGSWLLLVAVALIDRLEWAAGWASSASRSRC